MKDSYKRTKKNIEEINDISLEIQKLIEKSQEEEKKSKKANKVDKFISEQIKFALENDKDEERLRYWKGFSSFYEENGFLSYNQIHFLKIFIADSLWEEKHGKNI